jgi:ankyrin repeat protein
MIVLFLKNRTGEKTIMKKRNITSKVSKFFVISFIINLVYIFGQSQGITKINCYTEKFKSAIEYCDQGNTPACLFTTAINLKDYDSLECLTRNNYSPNVDSMSLNGQDTPIINASLKADKRILELFFAANINLETKDKQFGMTPLMWLCYFSENEFGKNMAKGIHLEMARLLIQRGADINTEDNLGATPLIYTSMFSKFDKNRNTNVDFVKLLLDNNADPNKKTRLGKTALMVARDNTEVINLLLEANADMEAIDKNGRTAIFYAVEFKQQKKLEILLKHSAIVNLTDYDGNTPLLIAKNTKKTKESQQIIELLKKYGAK